MRRYYKNPKQLCSGLCAIGVSAQLAERGRSEEQYFGIGSYKSLGLIDIAQSPIVWVNAGIWDTGDKVFYKTVYGVPDSRDLPRLQLVAVRIKSFPLFGKALDARWEPIDDTGIAQALTNDIAIRAPIMKLGRFHTDPIIVSYGTGYWLIIDGRTTDLEAFGRIPSLEEWFLYETVAKRLLATPLTYQKPEIDRSHAITLPQGNTNDYTSKTNP